MDHPFTESNLKFNDLDGRDHEINSLFPRGTFNQALENTFEFRDYADDVLTQRADSAKYDRSLLARELVDLILNNDYAGRDLDGGDAPKFEKRAPGGRKYIHIVGPGGQALEPFDMRLNRDTFEHVRDRIYVRWGTILDYDGIHLEWQGSEPSDYNTVLAQAGVTSGSTIHYRWDEGAYHEENAAPGAWSDSDSGSGSDAGSDAGSSSGSAGGSGSQTSSSPQSTGSPLPKANTNKGGKTKASGPRGKAATKNTGSTKKKAAGKGKTGGTAAKKGVLGKAKEAKKVAGKAKAGGGIKKRAVVNGEGGKK